MSATRIEGGIEWFPVPATSSSDGGEDCQCARCGSSCVWLDCGNCDEFGYTHHNCGEDSCCCLHPENNVLCDWCRGTGGSWHCCSSREWCEAHPLSGREGVQSTALRAEAWRE